MFARMSRYPPAARGIHSPLWIQATAQNGTSRQVPGICRPQFREKNRIEKRTLNPRVRGSSPWRRTRFDLGFYCSRSFFMCPFCPHVGSVFAREFGPGRPGLSNGSLCLDAGHGPEQLVDADYLVLRIECRTLRDDWRFPELDALIRAAGSAYINGYLDESNDRRTDAIARAWNSPDLIPADRIRVAKLLADEIDSARQLHAVPGPDRSLGVIAPQSLPARDAPELKELTLGSLLAL